jgi:CheY-like chemotaxis protein
VYLPRSAAKTSAAVEAKAEPRGGRSGECILVVEDDADVRGYVVETLGLLGYDVLEAADAEAALRLLHQYQTVQLLLTDVVLPGMNGRKLADEAKAHQPSLKVLYMTGYSRNAIVHQGRLDAGVDLIQKPLSSERLASTIRRILDA